MASLRLFQHAFGLELRGARALSPCKWRTASFICGAVHSEQSGLVSLQQEKQVTLKSQSSDTISQDTLPAEQERLEPGLYLVATPIGNLEDITLRALRVLRSVDLILAEDTRHSGKLLQHYDIRTPKISYHKFNERSRQEEILERLANHEALAIISDAGVPGISDPGADLVKACIEEQYKVIPVPGPSAPIAALTASGLPTSEFSFVGFLPPQTNARHKRLLAAAEDSSTQIFFVPPHKLCTTLAECSRAFGSHRYCVIARELTKVHEEFWRGTLEKAQEKFKEREPKGEVTLLIEGLPARAAERFPTEEELETRLAIILDSGKTLSEAVKEVTEETFVRRKLVYSIALKVLKKNKSEKPSET